MKIKQFIKQNVFKQKKKMVVIILEKLLYTIRELGIKNFIDILILIH